MKRSAVYQQVKSKHPERYCGEQRSVRARFIYDESILIVSDHIFSMQVDLFLSIKVNLTKCQHARMLHTAPWPEMTGLQEEYAERKKENDTKTGACQPHGVNVTNILTDNAQLPNNQPQPI